MKRTRKTPTRRVAAWIYVVLNPVIDAMQRERAFLERKNLTWRFSSGQSEFLRTIQEYIEPSQWPNYEDFVTENGLFGAAFKRHDEHLKTCNLWAQKEFEWLLSLTDFTETVQKLATQYRNEVSSLAFPGYTSDGDLPKYCAEYVVNNISELPSHYTLSGFWNSHNAPLLGYRSMPRFTPFLKHVEVSWLEADKLKRVCELRRLSLARQFDVPAAPVPGVSLDD